VEINTYTFDVVAALSAASLLALAIVLLIIRRRRSLHHAGHAPGGRLIAPPGSDGLWGEPDAWAGPPSTISRADEPAVETRRRRRRPLTADQKATRAAWARWRAAQAQTRASHD
jgi:hypothetical protein